MSEAPGNAARPRLRRGSVVLGLLLLSVAMICGCGKKGPPVAPGSIPVAAIADLEGRLDQAVVTLEWTHSGENARVKQYIILRAQTRLTQLEACTGCPLVFQKVGTQSIENRSLSEPHRETFSMTLPKGFRYTFSVRPVQSSGAQGPDSNLVEIMLP
jgi:predicted small lipoprotein YifL